MTINTYNNDNTSPPNDQDNEYLNTTIIVEDYDLDEVENLEEILDILEDNKIIKSNNFDREDTNTDKIHSHYYFDSDLNNNTLNSIIRNYVNKNIVDMTQIQKLKEKLMKDNTIKVIGIVDNHPKGFDIDETLKEELLLKDKKEFGFISLNKDKQTTTKQIGTNTGLSREDTPSELINNPNDVPSLRGVWDIDIHFNKDVKISNEIIEKSVYEVLERYNLDLDLINVKGSVNNNILNIRFNNLLVNKVDGSYNLLSFKIMKLQKEDIIKSISNNIDEVIKFKGGKDWVKDFSEIKEREVEKQEEKITKIEQTTKDIEPLEEETNTTNEVIKPLNSDDIKSKDLVFTKEQTTKDIKEIETTLESLNKDLIEIEVAKRFLSKEDFEIKKSKIVEKINILNILIVEKEEVNKIVFELDETKQSLEDTKKVVKEQSEEIEFYEEDSKKKGKMILDRDETISKQSKQKIKDDKLLKDRSDTITKQSNQKLLDDKTIKTQDDLVKEQSKQKSLDDKIIKTKDELIEEQKQQKLEDDKNHKLTLEKQEEESKKVLDTSLSKKDEEIEQLKKELEKSKKDFTTIESWGMKQERNYRTMEKWGDGLSDELSKTKQSKNSKVPKPTLD